MPLHGIAVAAEGQAVSAKPEMMVRTRGTSPMTVLANNVPSTKQECDTESLSCQVTASCNGTENKSSKLQSTAAVQTGSCVGESLVPPPQPSPTPKVSMKEQSMQTSDPENSANNSDADNAGPPMLLPAIIDKPVRCATTDTQTSTRDTVAQLPKLEKQQVDSKLAKWEPSVSSIPEQDDMPVLHEAKPKVEVDDGQASFPISVKTERVLGACPVARTQCEKTEVVSKFDSCAGMDGSPKPYVAVVKTGPRPDEPLVSPMVKVKSEDFMDSTDSYSPTNGLDLLSALATQCRKEEVEDVPASSRPEVKSIIKVEPPLVKEEVEGSDSNTANIANTLIDINRNYSVPLLKTEKKNVLPSGNFTIKKEYIGQYTPSGYKIPPGK